VAQIGENIIGNSTQTPFFKVANADKLGIQSPDNRLGDALRVWARSLSGFQKEAMVRSALTGDTWRFVCDEGPYLSGYDEAPCPLAFLSTGMVASFMNEILALGEQRNANIRSLKLVQDNFYTSKGSMLKRTMTGGAENIELQVDIDCDLEDDALTQFLTDATFASPLNGLMRGKLDSLFKLASNGVELRPSSSTELGAPMFPDPGQHFPNAEPTPSDLQLMWKVGTTPVKEVAKGTSTSGSSLSDEQDRRLNIGAIATMREDGVKQLQQMQYSPHGTSFGFLSSEDGRAPDANTLISAGIAFCFMTQFGRAASMLKLDLSAYRIIQDSHFSLGGASGRTGKAGEAHPIETHAFLQTTESDETAQEMLDIAERTCFLHAFCRTDLKTILKINRV
jgi:organic hydroperoxide reductase OsmC/OhrA